MRLFPDNPYLDRSLWALMGIFAVLLFFTGVVILALLIRQKRPWGLWFAVPELALSYFLFQCIATYTAGAVRGPVVTAIVSRFSALPDWLILSFCVVLAIGEVLILRNITVHERSRITPMSVKEATDSLPAGLLCYAPGGQVLLINHTMEEFSRLLTGDVVTDGKAFSEKLRSGDFLPGNSLVTVGDAPVVRLSDGTAWSLAEELVPFEKTEVQMWMVSNITDAYRKTLALRQAQEKVSLLNIRLSKVNQEIVALTAEQEILAAKVKIHDELGSNLLAIKRFLLNGGTEQEKAEIVERLRRSITFLQSEQPSVTDEYELMIGTAERLGVSVAVTGTLPQTEINKHILATAIHECFTNILRHARGDELRVKITETETHIAAELIGNGVPPGGEIVEKGGLVSLRALTERAGGTMTVRSVPIFSITLELPKEVENGL
jgi:hypothetical protein